MLRDVGAVICAAGDGLAPADKKLYALRDVTGTVEAIPLIASSIMSKKIAEGTGALVLDVKVGSGAFMKDAARARELAETMVGLGTAAGVRTVALLTAMDTPLGLTAGNALEVTESVEVLAGGGPADIVELTLALAREMLAAAGRHRRGPGRPAGRRLGHGPLAPDDRGAGRRPGRRAARGPRDPRRRRPGDRDGCPGWTPTPWGSPPGGSVPVGRARRTRSPPVPGWSCTPSRATTVRAGEPLLTLCADDPSRFGRALEALEGGIEVDGPTDGAATRAGPGRGLSRRTYGCGWWRLGQVMAGLNGSRSGGAARDTRGQLSRVSPTQVRASSQRPLTSQPSSLPNTVIVTL